MKWGGITVMCMTLVAVLLTVIRDSSTSTWIHSTLGWSYVSLALFHVVYAVLRPKKEEKPSENQNDMEEKKCRHTHHVWS
jgi:hypothetical protein